MARMGGGRGYAVGWAAHPVDKAGALEGHIRGADDEGLAGRRLEREDVVGGDAVLARPREFRVLWPAAHRDHKGVGSDGGLLALFVDRLDGVRVEEGGKGVVVLDIVAHQLRPITARARAHRQASQVSP